MTSLWGRVGTGRKEDESCTGHIWAAGFHRVMACSHLVCVLKSMKCLFPNISNFFFGLGHLHITETADAESLDTAFHLYLEMSVVFALPLYVATANSCSVWNENMLLEFLWVGILIRR